MALETRQYDDDNHDNRSAGSANAADATASNSANVQAEEPLPPRPASLAEERSILKQQETEDNHAGMKVGSTWYVLSTRWARAWKDYVGFDAHSNDVSNSELGGDDSFGSTGPGPIDNEVLLEHPIVPGSEQIKKHLLENQDFLVVSERMWKTLHSWYGGGPALPRRVVGSQWDRQPVIEIRLLTLKIHKSSSINESVTMPFSKTDTVGHLKQVCCERLALNPDDVRVWDYHQNQKFKLLDDPTQRLEGVQILDNQPMLLEEKGEDGKFPDPPKQQYGSSNSNYNSYSYSSGYSSYGGPCSPGTAGLSNLGNTCFMASALQCLSNTPPLATYFIEDRYKSDVNETNPLGTRGELAAAFAALMKQLWSGEHSVVAPRDFKSKLERFAPQFAGYQQHDSQELLGYLLDGLHEDLNRVKTKPYRDLPDGHGRPEEEVAREAWDYHRARNDSIIVDWFQGQFRSTLVCPKCDRVSVTFDPSMYLSLPLRMKTTRTVLVTFQPLDGARRPVRYGVEVPKAGTVGDLKKALGQMAGVDSQTIAVVDVFSYKFYKIYKDRESVDDIKDRDVIWAHEIPSVESGLLPVPVMLRKEEVQRTNSYNYYSYHSSYTRKNLFGIPFVLSVPETATYQQLYELACQRLQRFLRRPPPPPPRETTDEDSAASQPASSASAAASAAAAATTDDDDATQPMEPDNAAADGDGAPPAAPGPSSQRRVRNEDSSSEEEPDAMESESESEPVRDMFTIKFTDNSGQSDLDGQPRHRDAEFRTTGKMVLVANFDDVQLREFYNEAAEEDIEEHESARRVGHDDDETAAVTLADCIELFTQQEKLGPDDPWYCSGCKEHQQATKKMDLWSLPPILVVHLKRFSYKNRYFRDKLETFVDYPLYELNLTQWVKGPITADTVPIYDLFAVSNHYGSMGGGHYTAYAKNKNDGKWYSFDDSSVHTVEGNKARSAAGYVLFYRRRGSHNVRPDSAASASSSSSFSSATPATTAATGEENGDSVVADNSRSEPMDADSTEELSQGNGWRDNSVTDL